MEPTILRQAQQHIQSAQLLVDHITSEEETKQRLLRAIAAALSGKTSVFITHYLSSEELVQIQRIRESQDAFSEALTVILKRYGTTAVRALNALHRADRIDPNELPKIISGEIRVRHLGTRGIEICREMLEVYNVINLE